MGGAQPKNRAERRALANHNQAYLSTIAAPLPVGGPKRHDIDFCHIDGGTGPGICSFDDVALDAPKLDEDIGTQEGKNDECFSCDSGASVYNSTAEEKRKKKKARWTKEEKHLRQRHPRNQQQAAQAGSLPGVGATAAALESLIVGAPRVLKQPQRWTGPVFCNPFVEVARAIGALPSTPSPASTNKATTGAGLNESVGKSDGCSVSIEQLCQLPQMAVCKLQAKVISQVVTSLSGS